MPVKKGKMPKKSAKEMIKTLGKSLLQYFTEILLFANKNDALIICVPNNSLTIIK